LSSSEVKRIYERRAFEYEDFVIPCKVCQYNMLIGILDLEGDERGVDIGCGPGELTCMLAEKLDKGRMLGIDLSSNMVDIASEKARKRGIENVEFIAADYLELEYENKFDICVSSYLFHWLSSPLSFIRWVKQVLKKEGKLGLISPSPEWYKEVQEAYRTVMEHYDVKSEEMIGRNMYPQSDIEEYLEREGFEIQISNEFCFRENIDIESCLKRIDAKSDTTYFKKLPNEIKNDAIEMFFEELKENTEKLVTTESGYIIVAKNC